MTNQLSAPADTSEQSSGRLAWLFILVAICSGCAVTTGAQQAPPTPPVLATAYAVPQVGEVTPVFIEVVAPPPLGVAAHREDICALDQDGKCRPALDLEEAGRMAGGTDKLAAALAHDESAAGAVGRSMLSVSGQGLVASWAAGSKIGDHAGAGVIVLGTAATLTTALARGSYLAASPEARALDQVAAYSLASRENWNWYPNHRSGFVYFPSGKHQRIQVIAEAGQSRVTLWLEWPEGSAKTFDIQPGASEPTSGEVSPISPPTTVPTGGNAN